MLLLHHPQQNFCIFNSNFNSFLDIYDPWRSCSVNERDLRGRYFHFHTFSTRHFVYADDFSSKKTLNTESCYSRRYQLLSVMMKIFFHFFAVFSFFQSSLNIFSLKIEILPHSQITHSYPLRWNLTRSFFLHCSEKKKLKKNLRFLSHVTLYSWMMIILTLKLEAASEIWRRKILNFPPIFFSNSLLLIFIHFSLHQKEMMMMIVKKKSSQNDDDRSMVECTNIESMSFFSFLFYILHIFLLTRV